MIRRKNGKTEAKIPSLLDIRCLVHKLEMGDTLKANLHIHNICQILYVLNGIYNYSPRERDLNSVTEAMAEKVLKFVNLGVMCPIPQLQRAFAPLRNSFRPTEANSADNNLF